MLGRAYPARAKTAPGCLLMGVEGVSQKKGAYFLLILAYWSVVNPGPKISDIFRTAQAGAPSIEY
jgi:hypothetical protein